MAGSRPVRTRRVLGAIVLITSLVLTLALIITRARSVGRTDPTDQGLVTHGQTVYRANCAACHGANLEGQPQWKERLPSGLLPAPPHDVSGHTWHHPDSLLFTIVKDGGAAALLPGDSSGMPAFGAALSEEDIWAVLSYIKSTWPAEIQQRQSDVSRQATE